MKPLHEYGSKLLPLLLEYQNKGLVTVRKHPEVDVYVASYSKSVPYAKAWDDITLQARCVMVDTNGLVAKSFDKFFNIGEVPFVGGGYHVSDKIDGSLILAATYQNKALVASKSSFTSDHALAAQTLLSGARTHEFGTSYELTHPSYRIVIDYGAEPQLHYLGGVTDPNQKFAIVQEPSWEGFLPPTVSSMRFADEGTVSEFIKKYSDIEGFILTSFDNQRKYKIKTAWYLERHRVIFGLTPARIFEVCRQEDPDEFIMSLPDEFQESVRKKVREYQTAFVETKALIEKQARYFKEQSTTRKDYAAFVTKEPPNMRGPLFQAYETGIVPDDVVWRHLSV